MAYAVIIAPNDQIDPQRSSNDIRIPYRGVKL